MLVVEANHMFPWILCLNWISWWSPLQASKKDPGSRGVMPVLLFSYEYRTKVPNTQIRFRWTSCRGTMHQTPITERGRPNLMMSFWGTVTFVRRSYSKIHMKNWSRYSFKNGTTWCTVSTPWIQQVESVHYFPCCHVNEPWQVGSSNYLPSSSWHHSKIHPVEGEIWRSFHPKQIGYHTDGDEGWFFVAFFFWLFFFCIYI